MADRLDHLERARQLTYGDREKAYGSPVGNMAHIAELWTAYLGKRLSEPLTGSDVAWLNVLQKIARSTTSSEKRDHYDDAAAYAAIAGECANAE